MILHKLNYINCIIVNNVILNAYYIISAALQLGISIQGVRNDLERFLSEDEQIMSQEMTPPPEEFMTWDEREKFGDSEYLPQKIRKEAALVS